MSVVRMPLFQFCMDAKPDLALGFGFSMDRFQFDDSFRIPLFSEQDVTQMRQAQWALIYDGNDLAGYKALSNMALLAFRIFSPTCPPFIKFRLCEVTEESTRLNQPMTYNHAVPQARKPHSLHEMEAIRLGFEHLQAMDGLSARTHNAIYFLYRAFHCDKWIDSFLLMTSALESLFSKDAHGGATDAISTRVASLLGSVERCTKKDVEELYDLRSSMTHGRIVASDDPGENLKKLEHLEHITKASFRKLLESERYHCFCSKAARDAFMGTLNVAC